MFYDIIRNECDMEACIQNVLSKTTKFGWSLHDVLGQIQTIVWPIWHKCV